jgi:hypothetical protein
MLTVAETDTFIRYAASVWTDEERSEFVTWIANNPLSGDVIPGTGGLRKVRYTRRALENAAARESSISMCLKMARFGC